MNSESIEIMTDAEIGQYILLLAKSWLIGKECTLPDDPEYLAKNAHCDQVSPRVLAKFPVVQTENGPRRRNDVLYGEWMSSVERSNKKRDAVEVRWQNNRNTPVSHLYESRNTVDIPNQANQSIKPINQSNPVFKNIAIQYSSYFGNHSHLKKHIDNYAKAVEKYGEQNVLDCFKEWAASNSWVKEHKDRNHGLNFFWRPLDDMMAGREIAKDRADEEIQEKEQQQKIILSALEKEHEIIQKENQKFEEKMKQADIFAARVAAEGL